MIPLACFNVLHISATFVLWRNDVTNSSSRSGTLRVHALAPSTCVGVWTPGEYIMSLLLRLPLGPSTAYCAWHCTVFGGRHEWWMLSMCEEAVFGYWTVMRWYLFRKAEENHWIASTVQPTSLHPEHNKLLCDVMQKRRWQLHICVITPYLF